MNDHDFQVQREIQELRAEVRRLRRTVEAGLVLLGWAVDAGCTAFFDART